MDDSGIGGEGTLGGSANNSLDSAFMAKGGSNNSSDNNSSGGGQVYRAKCCYCRSAVASGGDDPSDPQGTPRPLMKCAGCLSAYYCSKEHQRVDWKRHKVLCKSIQAKLATVAADEAEAQIAHSVPVVAPPASAFSSTKGGIGLFPRRRYGSNTQLCLEQREQQIRAAAINNNTFSIDSSCRSSANGSPPNDLGGSASSSIHGSMADLISATPYHTSKGGRYSVVQTVGNPKRARFPLTVIRERRSSIGAGEAARLAAAAAAAAAAGKPIPSQPPPRTDSDSSSSEEDEEMDSSAFASGTLIGGGARRKRPASSSMRKHYSSGGSSTGSLGSTGGHMPADRCSSDADSRLHHQHHHRLSTNHPGGGHHHHHHKKDHRSNPILNLFTDPRFQLDAMVPRHTAFVLRVRRLATCVATALREYGWCAIDHFLGETHARAIYHETTSLYMTPGLFADGQLMKAAPPAMAGQSSKDVRSDQIYWFDNRVDRGVHISFLVSMVDSIVYHLTEHIPPYRINGRSRAMIACYPGNGTKYVRHVDNPDRDGRCVTTIYYLNENWKREHGGSLRMYPESSSDAVDIDPMFDRLLFFWSDRRNPHEVLPAYRNRFAITIWYFDAAERAEALAREQREQHQHDQQALAHVYQQQHQAATMIDPSMVAMKLGQSGPGAPRSASCADLVSSAGQYSQPPPPAAAAASLMDQTPDVVFRQQSDSPNSVGYSALAELQQQLRLDSPRQQSHVSTPHLRTSPHTPSYVDPSALAQYHLHQQQQQQQQQMSIAAGIQQYQQQQQQHLPSYADYPSLLQSDVIQKLLNLSARQSSQHDQSSAELQEMIRAVERGEVGRANLTSPSSPELDAIRDS